MSICQRFGLMKALKLFTPVLVIVAFETPLLQSCANQDPVTSRPVRHPVHKEPSIQSSPNSRFSKGDGFEKVAAVMGAPEIRQERDGGITVWNYKFSTITFKNGRVHSWNNFSKNLRCSGEGETDNLSQSESGSSSSSGNSIAVPLGLSANVINSSPNGKTNPSVQQVESYSRSDGTFVPSHYRTTPDASRSNNFSASGNVNPYTGKRGTR